MLTFVLYKVLKLTNSNAYFYFSSFLEIHKEFVKDLLGRRRNWQDSLRGTRVILLLNIAFKLFLLPH